MAGIVSTDVPTSMRRIALPLPRFRWLAIAALIQAMPGAIGRALAMAYVDPYAVARGNRVKVPDEPCDGRDPDW